jgi:1,4-alpha-glucan branching enzyme
MTRIHPDGVFEAALPCRPSRLLYRLLIRDAQGNTTGQFDPYAFVPDGMDSDDEDAFLRGEHYRLFAQLGAHVRQQQAVRGTAFAVWAPGAQRVSVVGSFNDWDGRRHPMRKRERSGIWELFVPGVDLGTLYKFEIRSAQGAVFLKSDPFAVRTESSPATASIVGAADVEAPASGPDEMIEGYGPGTSNAGSTIPSTQQLLPNCGPTRRDNTAGTSTLPAPEKDAYRDLHRFSELPAGPEAAPPLRASVFAPFDHPETPEHLSQLIETEHRAGRDVVVRILDTQVPRRFPELAWFDGTPLYEKGPESGDAAGSLDLDKPQVRSFVLSNAVFWADTYRADGWTTDQACARVIRSFAQLEGERFADTPLFVPARLPAARPDGYELGRLLAGRHDDPHALLGLHADGSELTLRALLPHAARAWVRFLAEPGIHYELGSVAPGGLYETTISRPAAEDLGYHLLVLANDGSYSESIDPYAFQTFDFEVEDQRRFASGTHYTVYQRLGAHPIVCRGISGTRFAVWAPNAEGVSVAGSFNHWDTLQHPMQRRGLSGVWELFLPGVGQGEHYQFAIHARDGATYLKADPYAFRTEVPPETASVVHGLPTDYLWRDQEWMEKRRSSRSWEQPVAIYEVHLGSWSRNPDHRALSLQSIAGRLIPYVRELGFTHIELLPIAEHPYEPSWGYQITGYFAPTSRLGSPEDLMAFIDQCHQNGIGVLLDWVPGHFPKDSHGLARFDGSALYEYEDPRKGEHRDWGTLVFNYGRHEVANFLLSNALFWLDRYHFDGLRVDAVASMLYLDYSRRHPGEWVPNQYGGRENLEAIDFLRHANTVLHREYPGVMIIAEESTAWPNVSRPVDQGGLGFGYKWNMGWMHDILHYLAKPPEQRPLHHHHLTFSLHYAFAENYVLALSHDEVVHLKRSLLQKMPGNSWEKFANTRLLYAFMYGHPGKKLLFMGAEFGQLSEWSHAESLEWHLLERADHRKLHAFVRELNALYRSEPELFEVDFKQTGFEWLQADNAAESTIAFLRKAKDPRRTLLFIINCSALSYPDYRVGVPYPVCYRTVFNTNWSRFGGADEQQLATDIRAEEKEANGREFSIHLHLPALSAIVLRPEPPAT